MSKCPRSVLIASNSPERGCELGSSELVMSPERFCRSRMPRRVGRKGDVDNLERIEFADSFANIR